MATVTNGELETPAAEVAVADSDIPSVTASRFYHPELDGLRFFAFVGVFFYHTMHMDVVSTGKPLVDSLAAWFASVFRAGEAGVDLFFVLSSYLITALLLREYQQTKTLDVKSFYIRRSLRIWPLYYFTLLFCLLIEGRIFGEQMTTLKEFFVFAVFLENWIPHTYHDIKSPADILWTVSIEEQFYLLWPVVVLWLKPRRIVQVALVMLAIANLSRFMLIQMDAKHLIHHITPCRLDALACGALAAAYYHNRAIPVRSRGTRWLLILAGFLTWVAAVRYFDIGSMFEFNLCFYPTIALGAVLIFLGTLQPMETERRGLFAWSPLVFLGRISYGLYVWHMFAIALVEEIWFGGKGNGTRLQIVVLSFALTIVIGIASYLLLEKPFLKLKLKFTHVQSRPGG